MKKTPVLHPYFFAVYAVLGVYAQSPQELPVAWIIRPLVILLGLTGLMYFGLCRYACDHQRAGFMTSLILAWVFIGHLRNLLMDSFSFLPTISQDILLIVAWGGLLALLGSAKVWSRIKIPELITNFLNVTSWVVVLLPLYFVGVFTFQEIKQSQVMQKDSAILPVVSLSDSSNNPDIYVIILDAYGRQDFLKDVFSFDNNDFVNFLQERGFFIAESSLTNYPQTQLSLSSLLNFQYPNEWTGGLEETNNRGPLAESIHHSRVRAALEIIGYQTINIPNSTLIGNMEDADIYRPLSNIRINQFEGLILSTTLLDIFAQRWEISIPSTGYGTHRRTTQHQLDTLKEIPGILGHKFVFVHILAPHPPFVFDRNGAPVQPESLYTLGDGGGFPGTSAEYEQGYSEQISYINQQMKVIVGAILQNSSEPPIILMMGDHGPGSRFDMLALEKVECLWERFSIFNAYYFPGERYTELYPSITPVNSFRVIFNAYFGTDLPILEDRNYYASYGSPYVFEDVTELITSSCTSP